MKSVHRRAGDPIVAEWNDERREFKNKLGRAGFNVMIVSFCSSNPDSH
jgi:hypothetical protein